MKKTVLAVALCAASLGAAQAEEVKFVTNAAYAPFEFVDENNEMQGFDIDLAKAICEVQKLDCCFHNQAFDSLIPSLKFRRYNAAIAAMDITPERAKQVDFSDIYYENSAVFVTPEQKFADADQLQKEIPGVSFNGDYNGSSLYTVLNVSFPKTDRSEMLLFNLDINGICVSGGSACSSGASQGSHVIQAISGNEDKVAVRFSFSKHNTKDEIDFVIEKLKKVV